MGNYSYKILGMQIILHEHVKSCIVVRCKATQVNADHPIDVIIKDFFLNFELTITQNRITFSMTGKISFMMYFQVC